MKIINKLKLANLSSWIMIITISIISIFYAGYIVSVIFDLNVFGQKTFYFLSYFFVFSTILVLCSAILNISLNIGIIADSKIEKSLESIESKEKLISKKLVFSIISVFAAVIIFLFAGDYFSKMNYKNKLINEAEDVISRYSESVNKISLCLNDTSKISELPETLRFISLQKQYFSDVIVITNDQFQGQPVYPYINKFVNTESLKKPFYDYSFYKCDSDDCKYLEKFFSGKTNETYFLFSDNEYKFYFPFDKNNKKFILVFTKNEYRGDGSGSIGS